MHTMHCARNITLCKQCNEPIPKLQYPEHEKSCRPPKPKKPLVPPTQLEQSSYFQTRKAVEDKKIEARKERYMQRLDKLVDTGYSCKDNTSTALPLYSMGSPSASFGSSRPRSYDYSSGFPHNASSNARRSRENGYNFSSIPNETIPKTEVRAQPKPQESQGAAATTKDSSSGLLACKYCDLELPKLDLEEHENYCGSRTDRCNECGELVMFKDKQAHMASNHSASARRNNIGKSLLFSFFTWR